MTARSMRYPDESGTFFVYVKDGFVRLDAHYDDGSRACHRLTSGQVRSMARELLEAAEQLEAGERT